LVRIEMVERERTRMTVVPADHASSPSLGYQNRLDPPTPPRDRINATSLAAV
jgi:hypothetical protein